MRILTLVNSLNIGGVENTLLSCLPYLKNNGYEIVMCCFQKGGDLEKHFIQQGVEIIYIKKTGSIVLDCIQIVRVLRKYKINIVHSRFGFTSGGFALASFIMRTPFVVSIHSSSPTSFLKYKNNVLLRAILTTQLSLHKIIILLFATKIVGHSKANLALNFKKWEINKKIILIYNGIDFQNLQTNGDCDDRLMRFLNGCSLRIVHIGSMRTPKNHLFLLECFKLLKPDVNGYGLVLVGDGSLREQVVKRIIDLDLEAYVYIAGFDSNISKYLINADVFYFPSIIEGFANVLVEAQYLEVPICASNLPAFRESVFEDYHKYFFDPKDSIDATRAFHMLKEDIDNNNIDVSVRRAKEFALNNFSIQSMVSNLSKLYRELEKPKIL